MGKPKPKLRSMASGSLHDYGLSKQLKLRKESKKASKKAVKAAKRFIRDNADTEYDADSCFDACLRGSMPEASNAHMRRLLGHAFTFFPEQRNSVLYKSFKRPYKKNAEKMPLSNEEEKEDDEDEEDGGDDDDKEEFDSEEEQDGGRQDGDAEEEWDLPPPTVGAQQPIEELVGEMDRDLHDAVQEVVEHGYTHFMTVEGDGACFYRAVLMGAILAAHGARSNSRRASMLDRLDAMADAVSAKRLDQVKALLYLSEDELSALRVDTAIDVALVSTARALAAEYLQTHYLDEENGVALFDQLVQTCGDHREQWDAAHKEAYVEKYCEDVIEKSREWADDFVINYGLLPRALGIRTQIHYVTRVPQKSKRKGKGKDKKKNKGKDKDKGSMLGSIAIPSDEAGAFTVHLLRSSDHFTVLIKKEKEKKGKKKGNQRE